MSEPASDFGRSASSTSRGSGGRPRRRSPRASQRVQGGMHKRYPQLALGGGRRAGGARERDQFAQRDSQHESVEESRCKVNRERRSERTQGTQDDKHPKSASRIQKREERIERRREHAQSRDSANLPAHIRAREATREHSDASASTAVGMSSHGAPAPHPWRRGGGWGCAPHVSPRLV